MTDENAKATGEASGTMPVFRLEKLYVKDLSFESPNAPEAFFLKNPEPKADLRLELTNKKIDENHREVCIEISLTMKDSKSEKVLFIIEIEHAGAFLLQNIPEEHMHQVLHVDCPTLLFPYTRQIVNQASLEGGFGIIPIFMDPMQFNFAGMYHHKMKQQQAKKEN